MKKNACKLHLKRNNRPINGNHERFRSIMAAISFASSSLAIRGMCVKYRLSAPQNAIATMNDDDVTRLIAGTDVEELAFNVVSDNQLYGRKHCRRESARNLCPALFDFCRRVI